ncbi:uncharacterized protein Z520_10131 [Fonsecaea multimorphosa CBS 102226]|uniref:Uncharacterized protein n=1 Tax=Fonsecaea multimorphosa CBS 102226 TaxID=1442371 RepID=A0A0D2GWX0_9EURO|nr:uncharacterized protein Z520_10131 [Fonsecaea multimorphosa CBS 102226]KIX94105.1 hypothetical protein Z520_10131 [Fonsecaea multimorphosa CBS 102226]
MLSVLEVPQTQLGLAFLGVAAVVWFGFSTVISYRKLSHIPGPWLACFSQLWIFNVTSKGDLYLTMEEVLHKYGSPARIGPNMIMTDDPEFVRVITAPRSPFRRGHWYKGMKIDPRINNLLSEQDEKRHAELRAKMMPGYTGKEVPNLEESIDDRVLDLVNLIQREGVEKRAPIDFAVFAQYFTLDSLTHIAFGRPFGFLIENKDLYDYNKSSTAFFPVMEMSTNLPFIHSILSSSLMQALAGPKPEDKAGLGAIIGIAQKIVADRFNPNSESKNERDMLNSFIRHGLTQLEAESESLLQILAGSDSTATTIRMTFMYILTNPAVYATLRGEIDGAIQAGHISFPVVKNAEANTALPYLQACIKEGLRLWQPLNGMQTKLSPPDAEIVVSGVRVPPGTQVGLSQHTMMRRRDLFGPDAAVFRPERWLEADPDTAKAYERVWELSFAEGRFSCLGKGIALMELNKVFVELFRRFDFGIVNPVRTMETKCHQIHVQRKMYLHVTARAS